MRNRTELVTTTLPGSENEEDQSDLEDSEEDWKPAEKKKGAKVVPKGAVKAGGKRKSPNASKSKKPASKKSKKDESEEDEDEDEEEDEDEDIDDEDEDDEEPPTDGKGKKTIIHTGVIKAPRKSGSNNAKNFPDKDGKFELFLFKDDLAKDFRNDPKLCMWRRDGSSLLQKYIKVKEEEVVGDDVVFAASSVYSCWEEKRKHDFFQIKVQCIGEKKDGKVKVIDVEELAKFAAEDRPKVEAIPAANTAGDNEEDEEEAGDEEEEEEEGDEDDGEEEE